MNIGFFGYLGSGNVGNDGSFEALLAYVRDAYPDAELHCLCTGPDDVESRHHVPAAPMHWYRADRLAGSRLPARVWKAIGKVADARVIWRWLRSVDVAVVPGMGVLEATLPLRPWGMPYSLLLLTVAGRLTRTPVALVCVGCAETDQPVVRRIIGAVGRLASYRSYRDHASRRALTRMGVDTGNDSVFPDLAFTLPLPAETKVTSATGPTTVGVGVMSYHGTYRDRARAHSMYAKYLDELAEFVGWLVGRGYQVRLFAGDPADEQTAAELVALVDHPLETTRPASLPDLMRELAHCDFVVASRFHTVLSALRLRIPTISLGYAQKNDVLMAAMGLGEFCQSIRAVDSRRLVAQFEDLVTRHDVLTKQLDHADVRASRAAGWQFDELSAVVLEGSARHGEDRRFRDRKSVV